MLNNRITTALLTTAFAAALAAAPAQAQHVRGISLEVRGGLNVPMNEFDDAGANSEVGFGGDVIFNVTEAVSLYGGWGRDQFDCSACTPDDEIHSSGFETGVKLIGVRQGWGVLPWARVGATFHKLSGELSGSRFESDRTVGFQASVGLDIPVGEVLSLSPGVRFHNRTAEFTGPLGLFETEQGVRFVSLDLGAHFHLR